MKSWIRGVGRRFELYCGWFFVNGWKQEEWADYLKDKYKDR